MSDVQEAAQPFDKVVEDVVFELIKRLKEAYPDLSRGDIASQMARCALRQAGVKARAVDEFMATAPRLKVW